MYRPFMETFIEEVETYCRLRRIKPSTLIRYSTNGRTRDWDDWVAGNVSPTMNRVEHVRDYMANNAPIPKRIAK